MSKMQPFPWYGSKVRHLHNILPVLPETKRFVSAFGGSGSVLLNRDPSGLEVFNDLDGNVVAFFEVLRDRPDDLLDWLHNTPYHEEIFEKSKDVVGSDRSDLSEVERAGYFFVRATMGYNAWSKTFAHSKEQIRRDRSQHTSRYQYKIGNLQEVADRLHRVQFMQRDFRQIIRNFDRDGTLLYADPPYPPGSRATRDKYRFEMGKSDHRDLLDLAADYPEKMAISSYRTEMYDDYLIGSGWSCVAFGQKRVGAGDSEKSQSEVMYVNYDPGGGDFEVIECQ